MVQRLTDLTYLCPMSAEDAAWRLHQTEPTEELINQALSIFNELGWIRTGYNRKGQPVYRPPFEDYEDN